MWPKTSTFPAPTRRSNDWLLAPALLLCVVVGKVVAMKGLMIGVLLILAPIGLGFVAWVFLKPRVGLIFLIFYVFIIPGLGRHVPGPQFGLGQDGMMVLITIAIIFHRSGRFRWRHLNNDLFWLSAGWALMTVLQIVNPERPSIMGWFYEMRSQMLYWIFAIPLTFMLLNKKSDLDLFLNIIIGLSLVGAFYGMKQLYFGTDDMENRWLAAGAHKTHLLFGKLRVFSFYTEAGQFGASQAQLAIMCVILATGPYSWSQRIWYGLAGMFIGYGYVISGTRGAMAAIAGGGLMYLILSKQTRILVLGIIAAFGAFAFLKYTTIGNGNASIVRLRTALDPNDPSLMVRLYNQAKLRDYLATRPFGTGVGTIGQWGEKYNHDKYISTIPPDSLYVKIWAMYGIVGFWYWFGIMLYIIGKSSAIIWNTRDEQLRFKLIALCGGSTGILFCSYGNEVLNQMPSSLILYISWAMIWMSPRWDTPPPPRQITANALAQNLAA